MKKFTMLIVGICLLQLSSKIAKGQHILDSLHISGKVIDEKGIPIAGVTVSMKGTKKLTKTSTDGDFSISTDQKKITLLFRYIGYEQKEVEAKPNMEKLLVRLKSTTTMMEDVVVTGMVDRKREGFTGAARTISGEDLRAVGNQNVIQNLRTLDPSFVLVENQLNGSNPNALADVRVRGTTSLGANNQDLADRFNNDPNAPLFILNGFESSLRQITDLDMNRIASITILKDAASTAIYGSRSANGVIVVETIKPKAGALSLRYTSDFRFEQPDLSGYNMMNAGEKLEFERLAGRYTVGDRSNAYNSLAHFYNERLKLVRKGVNTYWLAEPLRTGFTHKHSMLVEGGTEEFLYGVGVNLQSINGTMKGSGRNNWETNADLIYRKGKVNISNRIMISGNKANESPYGSFDTYVDINPYYEKGNKDKYLESIPVVSRGSIMPPFRVPNMLYNAELNSEKYSNNFSIQNNLNLIWDISSKLRFTGGFQILKHSNSSIEFVSPMNTLFDNTAVLEKGSYSNNRNERLSYTANTLLSYNTIIDNKHTLGINIRGELQENRSNTLGFTAVGFPQGVPGNPAFAHSYLPNSKPNAYLAPLERRINAMSSINYAYDSKYFFDSNYRLDGSTAFGSAKKHAPFWSAGLGWNINRERFMKEAMWLNTLRLTVNVGSTGNQNLGNFNSVTVYNLEQNSNDFGQAFYHNSLGNPNLAWQKTFQTSMTALLNAFDNRLTASINAYKKQTSPLVATVQLPSSTGILNYPMNTGSMIVKGMEAIIGYSPIYNLKERTIWTLGLTGNIMKSRYSDLGHSLNGLNQEQMQSNSLQRYADGNSPDDIWAVVSRGIDPSSGNEIFLKKNGDYSFIYDPQDIRVVGSRNPLMEGVISTTLRIKGFTMGANVRFRLGAYSFNHALYDKVENISYQDLNLNQDRRALHGRWKQPGDLTEFKGISLTDHTPISSRFVQKENLFAGESFSLGYEILSSSSKHLRLANIKRLRFTAFTNDIFRISNITIERGTAYPFSRSVSFSINATF